MIEAFRDVILYQRLPGVYLGHLRRRGVGRVDCRVPLLLQTCRISVCRCRIGSMMAATIIADQLTKRYRIGKGLTSLRELFSFNRQSATRLITGRA
ncbi:MAG: hypothetical protein R3A10_16715 [Caldilineaceae bacterium]